MGVRFARLVLVVLVGGCSLVPSADARELRPARSCPPAGAAVLTQSTAAAVYIPRGVPPGYARACSKVTRRQFEIVHWRHHPELTRIAGSWVAWIGEAWECFCGGVQFLDVRTGARREWFPLWQDGPEPQYRELVLTRRGSAGWILERDGVREVHKFDAGGGERLESRRGAILRRLRLRGTRLAWDSGPATRSYRLDRRIRCGRRGSVTMLRSPLVRAYRVGGVVFGCALATGRRTRLGRLATDSTFSGYGLKDLRLAGAYAAFEVGVRGPDTRLDIRVVDVRDGRTVRRFACCSDDQPVMSALVLAPSGAVAWTQFARGYEVVGWSDTAEPVVLDRVDHADLQSLRLEEGTLHWTNRGSPRSIRFP